MLYIKKNNEPEELVQARRNNLTRYDDMNSGLRNTIKCSLIAEQGHLCAYCMCRIYHNLNLLDNEMQIEHYIAQNSNEGKENSALSVDYSNMLAVCPGGKENHRCRLNDLTCDQHRGNIRLTVNPLDSRTIDMIKYKSDGIIYSDDNEINNDLNNVLNLNCIAAKLPQNRKAVLDGFKNSIFRKYGNKVVEKKDWEKLLQHYTAYDEEGSLIPFVGIIIEYIKRKL